MTSTTSSSSIFSIPPELQSLQLQSTPQQWASQIKDTVSGFKQEIADACDESPLTKVALCTLASGAVALTVHQGYHYVISAMENAAIEAEIAVATQKIVEEAAANEDFSDKMYLVIGALAILAYKSSGIGRAIEAIKEICKKVFPNQDPRQTAIIATSIIACITAIGMQALSGSSASSFIPSFVTENSVVSTVSSITSGITQLATGHLYETGVSTTTRIAIAGAALLSGSAIYAVNRSRTLSKIFFG